MTLLIFGLFLWTQAHLFKRLAPERHAAMGDKSKRMVTAMVVVSILAMIIGYRTAAFIPVWTPSAYLVHINNPMMLVAFFLIGMSATTGRLKGRMRHPMLAAVQVWALAHLLVNGDLASIILFGGMILWAVASIILINRAEPEYVRPEPGPASKDKILVFMTIGAFIVVALIHIALGVSPLPS